MFSMRVDRPLPPLLLLLLLLPMTAVLMASTGPRDLVQHLVKASREVRSIDVGAAARLLPAIECFLAHPAQKAIMATQKLKVSASWPSQPKRPSWPQILVRSK